MSPASQADEQPVGQIYLASTEEGGAAPRCFTTGHGLDAAPRWSPDGATLAFISDRTCRGTSQLYVIDPTGGEARCLTDEKGGVSDPYWSPDGRTLAYLVKQAASEEQDRHKKDRDDAIVASDVQERKRLWLIAPNGSAARALTPEDRHTWAYAWSPDGTRTAAVTSATSEFNEPLRCYHAAGCLRRRCGGAGSGSGTGALRHTHRMVARWPDRACARQWR